MQIIPPEGWVALKDNPDGESGLILPLVCWALGSEGNSLKILGMITDPEDERNIIPANTVKGFAGYVPPFGPEDHDCSDDEEQGSLN